MYKAHFGLREAPFTGQPAPRSLYCRAPHRELLASLRRTLMRAANVATLTGVAGSGKTVTCRLLLRALPANAEVVLVTRPPRELRELLARMLAAPKFHAPAPDASTEELFEHLCEVLARARARGRLPLVIVDDAHVLTTETLAGLARLASHGVDGVRITSVLLVGRDGLHSQMQVPEAHRLDGLVAERLEMAPFSAAETSEYIAHRLRAAGGAPELFTGGAVQAIHAHTAGIPRHIDILCEQALLGAYFANCEHVDRRHVLNMLKGGAPARAARADRWPQWLRVAATFGSALAGTLLLILWWAHLTDFGPAPAPPEPRPVVAPAPQATVETIVDASPALPRPAAATTAAERERGARASAAIPLRALADELSTRREVAQRRLLARWRLSDTPISTESLCTDLRTHGLRCLHGTGDLATIERLNRPALLTLWTQDERNFHAVLAALGEDEVTLDVDGYEYSYPRAELDQLWHGEYLLLWRPPLRDVEVINASAAPDALAWLRAALERVQGTPVRVAEAQQYDWPLTKRVMEFQRSAGLQADGTVGAATFIALQSALAPDEAPVLRQARFGHLAAY
ncbi:MAG: AAA family ATPase [Gammaproteobacteria bacterium]|nr:AAA family ATPase [Gammaproteobacteria bacterium]